jgi:hypothetical protein
MLSAVTLIFAAIVLGGRAADTNPISGAKVDDPRVPADLVDVFDRSIQKRFHEVLGFGMARISIEHQFVPETAEEKAAVRSFKKANLKLALYLAGRLVLEPQPIQSDFNRTDYFKRALSNPRFVGPKTEVKELPNRFELWKPANEAMMSFSQGNELFESQIGTWQLRAHPVRASSECLQCHSVDRRVIYPPAGGSTMEPTGNIINVGDPIGALLYLYSVPN